MSDLLETFDGVHCNGCGAVRAPRGPYDGLCGTCWRKAGFGDASEYTGSEEQEAVINSWLARKLQLDLIMLDKFGVVGRCEALSQRNEYTGERFGYQCGSNAVVTHEGFKVCKAHRFSPKVRYVDTPSTDTYAVITFLIGKLARKDKNLLKAIKDAFQEPGT